MRILIIGYGDVAQRFTAMLQQRPAFATVRWYALVRKPESAAAIQTRGGKALLGDLDDFRSLHRLAGVANVVLYLAPPPAQGTTDPRLTRALAALRGRARRIVYASTTGVYGHCHGEEIDETRPLNPESARAKRRVAAENALRAKPAQWSVRLRVPGIYANDRLPLERIQRGTPAVIFEEDSYSNHIHADDLARIIWLAIFRGHPHRSYNTVDNSQFKMGQWFTYAVNDRVGVRGREAARLVSVLSETCGFLSTTTDTLSIAQIFGGARSGFRLRQLGSTHRTQHLPKGVIE